MKLLFAGFVAVVALCLQPLGAGALMAPPAAHTATVADVASLRKKLGSVATALKKMLTPGGPGALANSAVAPEIRAFVAEVTSALAGTSSAKDPTVALHKLRAAQAGLVNLTEALTAQQTTLMQQGEEEQSSLLLGVLMTSSGKPMAQQVEILRSPDFKELAVSKSLLAHPDPDKPLFQQAAAFMDAHGAKQGRGAVDQAAKLAKTVEFFSSRVATLKKEEARAKSAHDAGIERIDALINKKGESKDNKDAQSLQILRRQSEREFTKHMVKHHEQTQMMEDVLAALKNGDMTALAKAQVALQASLKRMQQRTGEFLHFIQLGHRLQQRDCPYCAAQCIDKCHSAGNPYAQCLSDCADAGK